MVSDCRKTNSQLGKQLLIDTNDVPDNEILEPTYDEDDNEDDNDVLLGGVGESLVVRKNLLAPKQEDDEDWLWANIFHTFYTIKDKVCKVNVDNGSCENVISQ